MATRMALRPLRRALLSAAPATTIRTPASSRIARCMAASSPAARLFRSAYSTTSDPLSPAEGLETESVALSAGPDSSAVQDIDWTTSYYGLATKAFPKEVVDVLMQPLNINDIEVKPDGVIYLPEIKYRRVLHSAFGPGGWGMVPRGDPVVGDRVVTREYAFIAHGRFVSQAQGENSYFSTDQLPSAVEGCKSNALMRCCKDLGVATELWDPVFVKKFRTTRAENVWVEDIKTKKKKQIWVKKGLPVDYPYKRTSSLASNGARAAAAPAATSAPATASAPATESAPAAAAE